MDPFPESGTIECAKCGHAWMEARLCDEPAEHLLWRCPRCGWETQTACKDAKPAVPKPDPFKPFEEFANWLREQRWSNWAAKLDMLIYEARKSCS